MATASSRSAGGADRSVDGLMERASQALLKTEYFETEKLCLRALWAARRARDFERMSRIALPLQEARRQRRQIAVDAGPVAVIARTADVPKPLVPGMYLVQPPMIGAEARTLRESLFRRGVPGLVLCREPLTRDGKWPIVAVGTQVIRCKVEPPRALERVEKGSITKDAYPQEADGSGPSGTWFDAAAEALGDAAIAKLVPDDVPEFRVDDLLEFLDAHPDHEKLHQRLADACREAIGTPEPETERRRGLVDDEFVF
ncbi:MAG: hypothetical protein AAF747_05580 [Planctomycetota bacterium]